MEEDILKEFIDEIIDSQEDLPVEVAKVIREDLWDII